MPLPRRLARFNRKATNRVLGPLANVTPPFAWIEHRGRNSGRVYRTPVWAFRTDEGFAIAMTYGRSTEWVKNVEAAGGCILERRGRRTQVGNPRVVGPERALAAIGSGLRPLFSVVRIEDWLLLDR